MAESTMIVIDKTDVYDKWFGAIKSQDTRDRVRDRLDSVSMGNFGDHKSVGGGVWELRCNFAGGIRIYYTYSGHHMILLLAGGDKSTQRHDIAKAKRILLSIRR